MEKQKQSRRLLSLDALRGFDMFFIMGGASLFVALATLFPNSFFQAIGGQMDHVEWDGLTHHDFPAVSVHCRHLVSILVGKAARTGEERVGYL